jgi:hypothetical protein
MSLIRLDFRSFYFIIFEQAIFFFGPFWLLIPLDLMSFASPSIDCQLTIALLYLVDGGCNRNSATNRRARSGQSAINIFALGQRKTN